MLCVLKTVSQARVGRKGGRKERGECGFIGCLDILLLAGPELSTKLGSGINFASSVDQLQGTVPFLKMVVWRRRSRQL